MRRWRRQRQGEERRQRRHQGWCQWRRQGRCQRRRQGLRQPLRQGLPQRRLLGLGPELAKGRRTGDDVPSVAAPVAPVPVSMLWTRWVPPRLLRPRKHRKQQKRRVQPSMPTAHSLPLAVPSWTRWSSLDSSRRQIFRTLTFWTYPPMSGSSGGDANAILLGGTCTVLPSVPRLLPSPRLGASTSDPVRATATVCRERASGDRPSLSVLLWQRPHRRRRRRCLLLGLLGPSTAGRSDASSRVAPRPTRA